MDKYAPRSFDGMGKADGTYGVQIAGGKVLDWALPTGGGGGGGGYQPGSADALPISPGAKNDEFDGTSSVAWLDTPTTLTTWTVNSLRASHAYLRANGKGNNFVGKIQAVPGTYPYTITAKVKSATLRGNFNQAGVVLAPAAPGSSSPIVHMGRLFASGHVVRRDLTTFAGSFSSNSTAIAALGGWIGDFYIKVTVASATSLSWWASTDGWAWYVGESGMNPGFTPGNMGIIVAENGTADMEGYFDFFRVT